MLNVQEVFSCNCSCLPNLEKEMVTHSSLVAWKIHGQRRLVDYIPWGHKRVGHHLVSKQQQLLLSS